MKNPIHTSIDFHAPGLQRGVLEVPNSYNLSGWAQVLLPVQVMARGEGPTVLLTAGNHGDEYPGQVGIMRLMRELKLEDINGRLIMIPVLNPPAAGAATRLSPLDGKNFNRCFPGDPSGSVSEITADFLSHTLFPMADVVIDLHTGGRGVVFHPCAHMHWVQDPAQRARMAAATAAFGTDIAFLYADVAGRGLLPTEVEQQGKTMVSTELGGGESLNAEIHQLCQGGVRRVLRHLGLLRDGAGEDLPRDGRPPRWVQALDREDYVFSPESGLFEPRVALGADVTAGDVLGALHFPENPIREPVLQRAKSDGVIVAHRGPPLTRQGDILFCLAHDVSAEMRAELNAKTNV
ncbi:succinylglutamate desuccinylase/aspartoacylase family protein [Synoicihabitans lomoniglobus]|uniref:Succinylglutamate desuccinylase/aspartoacylase family protein n=1 Tax=Synoicihabitans lomoniglobus TaxID=2909285 RepID=A0AAF0CN75_9BACT|nr:succinylglutamate desuccinylase/aspartoacylase family protein [Opitutaceae bacterium LMO-M01]WED64070.1 succinylglutamate desuccinylase/aspartoacylase family protein [Opitutaceae bacterium LMO-M01]